MSASSRRKLWISVLPLMIVVILSQRVIDPISADLHSKEKTVFSGLSNEFILGPMLGLGQAVAGALWVRADEFFHEGDYDAILPMVRMVTWLDPHQLDVYITGAWHLAYNFTDSSERSDRRYLPCSQALLREGDANNNGVYDIAFELGWQNTDKLKNYDEAETWFRTATTRRAADDRGRLTSEAPVFVWHQLAHSLARQGRIAECIGVWKVALAKSEAKVKADPKNFQTRNVRDSEQHNLVLTLKRLYSRTQHRIDFDVDKQQTQSINMDTGEPTPKNAYIATKPSDGVPVGTPRKPAVVPAWNCAFDATVSFPEPKVMEPRGQFNVGDGARVTISLHDDDYYDVKAKEFSFDIDQSRTIMVDQHSVRKAMWGRKIDMSKDPKMYSFSRDHYYLVFEFNPRGTSPFIQDRFGWSGEGMADKKYLWTIPSENPKSPPVKILRKVFRLSRDQIMGERPVTNADVVPNAEYDRVEKQLAARAAAKSGGAAASMQ